MKDRKQLAFNREEVLDDIRQTALELGMGYNDEAASSQSKSIRSYASFEKFNVMGDDKLIQGGFLTLEEAQKYAKSGYSKLNGYEDIYIESSVL